MGRQFFRVNIEITNICNLQCSFCPAVVRPKGLIGLDDFRNTIRQVAPLTKTVALHLMGEPLVHPHLPEILDICQEHDVDVFLVTNGVLLREKDSIALLHPTLRQISFSLHSFPDNFPDKSPDAYLDRIFAFTEKAMRDRPSLFINYRLWNLKDSRGQQPKNLAILRRLEQHFDVRVPEVDLDTKKSWVVAKMVSLHFDTEFVWPNLNLPVLGERGRCHGLTGNLGVLINGTVVPCCLDKEGEIALGNLHKDPLKDILKSPRAQNMIAGFREGRLVEDLCRRCNFIERFA